MNELKEFLKSNGADLAGFACLDELDKEVRYDFPYGISFACALNPDIVTQLTNGPTLY